MQLSASVYADRDKIVGWNGTRVIEHREKKKEKVSGLLFSKRAIRISADGVRTHADTRVYM